MYTFLLLLLTMENTCSSVDVQLSEHFRLSEFTRSATAILYGIDNTPQEEHIDALKALCDNVLEPLRRRFGVIRITSGYRCRDLNEKVGGVRTSQHLTGEAADIHVGSRDTGQKYFDFIRDNLDFDQLLLEMKGSKVHCLHISYSTLHKNRHLINSYYHVK